MTLILPEPGFQGHWSFPSSREVPVLAIATATDVQQRFVAIEGFYPKVTMLLSGLCANPSVVCLSLTFVRRTQGIEAFGNTFSPLYIL